MNRYTFTARKTEQGMRLDHFVSAALGNLSKRRAKNLVDEGDVFINGSRQKIASWQLKEGDTIEITLRGQPQAGSAKKIFELTREEILYLDENLVIINKPAGLAAQPTRDPDVPHVVTVLSSCLQNTLGEDGRTLLPVHRLDKETTGCLVVARNRPTMTYMTELFRRREVAKLYHAVCYGLCQNPFTETAPLSPIHPATGRVAVVRSGGRSARTEFTPIEQFAKHGLSLIACHPYTGRSHQIRVHLEKNGYPIAGDKVYGNPLDHTALSAQILAQLSHHMLHAREISFIRPGEERPATMTAPYPETMQKLLSICRLTPS